MQQPCCLVSCCQGKLGELTKTVYQLCSSSFCLLVISIWTTLCQIMMLVGTVLGPGSIFIMLAGGLSIAFGLSNGWSFLVNLVPISIFILICFYAKPKYQIQGSRGMNESSFKLGESIANPWIC